jgi:hypothetical protein
MTAFHGKVASYSMEKEVSPRWLHRGLTTAEYNALPTALCVTSHKL